MSAAHDHQPSPAHAHADEPSHGAGDGYAHGHGRAQGHAHDNVDFSRAYAIGIALNTVFVAVEAFYGWRVNSLALLADAGHNLSDVAGLAVAWGGVLAGSLR
ncbi:MAG TPA: cation transporter, partial [Caldimonas sp.]